MISTTEAEALAQGILTFIADHQGQHGRIRTARICMGLAVGMEGLEQYVVPAAGQWPIRTSVELVDALLAGGLLEQTAGPRPTLVLTRPGFRALDSLEGLS